MDDEDQDEDKDGSWNVNVSNHKDVNYNDTVDLTDHTKSEVTDYKVPITEHPYEVNINNNNY